MSREVEGATHGAQKVTRVPKRACLGFAPQLEALLIPQLLLEELSGGLRGSLHLPYRFQAGRTVELVRQGVGLGGPVGEQVEDCASSVLLGDAQSAGDLHQEFG